MCSLVVTHPGLETKKDSLVVMESVLIVEPKVTMTFDKIDYYDHLYFRRNT